MTIWGGHRSARYTEDCVENGLHPEAAGLLAANEQGTYCLAKLIWQRTRDDESWSENGPLGKENDRMHAIATLMGCLQSKTYEERVAIIKMTSIGLSSWRTPLQLILVPQVANCTRPSYRVISFLQSMLWSCLELLLP